MTKKKNQIPWYLKKQISLDLDISENMRIA
jgi:hypothetical protein